MLVATFVPVPHPRVLPSVWYAKGFRKVLTNIFHQIGWVIGINGMPYTYVTHVIFVQLIGMGVLQWFRHDRAQTVVLCVMIHYCSVAIVVGYNKITALKIKPGCTAP